MEVSGQFHCAAALHLGNNYDTSSNRTALVAYGVGVVVAGPFFEDKPYPIMRAERFQINP
jgi:hypothetical protein